MTASAYAVAVEGVQLARLTLRLAEGRPGVERVGDHPLPLSWRLALLSQAVAELSEMALWLREAELGTGGRA